MEKESWINEEEARVAAGAEIPVRDLAREAGVDDDTKAVFDKRAEQRGDEALNAYREDKESKSELLNPELKIIKDKKTEIEATLIQQFGGYLSGSEKLFVPTLLNYNKDEKGELTYICLSEFVDHEDKGVGPLGQKIVEDGLGMWKNVDDKDNWSRNFLMAYKNDPELKVLTDEFIELHENYNANKQRRESILKEKENAYDETSNINTLLGRLGHSKRLPEDLNLNQLQYRLREGENPSSEEDIAQVKWIVNALSGLTVPAPQEEDLKPDLDIIQNKITALIMSATMRYRYNSPEAKSLLNEILTPEVAKKFEYEGFKIYSIKS